MSISQADIARQVGVSRTAVSHVLNGRPHMVGPEVRERILSIVETVGYHRNALVRALKSNRTHVVGIIVPRDVLSFFSEIVQAAESSAMACGLQCFLCQSRSSPEALERHVAALREYRVDGILAVPTSSTNHLEIYRLMQKQHFPFVLVDSPVLGLKVPFVGNENVVAGRLAVEHLVSLGHRRIACISGYHEAWPAMQRLKGYRQAMIEAGLTPEDDLICGGSFDFEAGRNAIASLLDRKIDFTAVVAHADEAALGAIRTLVKRGLRVPEDISVVGCGNLDISGMTTPALTTVDQEPRELGRVAMELLVDIINGKAKSSREIIVQPSLVVRESTAKLSARDSS